MSAATPAAAPTLGRRLRALCPLQRLPRGIVHLCHYHGRRDADSVHDYGEVELIRGRDRRGRLRSAMTSAESGIAACDATV